MSDRRGGKKKNFQETNAPLFHLSITLRQMSQHDIEINYRSPCHISSLLGEILKEKLEPYTEGNHAIPTLKRVLANRRLPQRGITVWSLLCTQPAMHVSPDGREHSIFLLCLGYSN